jgi:hypothetical protein
MYVCIIGMYQERFIPEGVAEVPQIFLRDTHSPFTKNYVAMSNTADVTDGKPIAVLLQSISGVIVINP